MYFEWDEDKRAANLAKHKVDFELAKEVFSDPFAVSRIDDRMDYGEMRCLTLGRAGGFIILAVAHTDRHGNVRIISARRAGKRERRIYYESQV